MKAEKVRGLSIIYDNIEKFLEEELNFKGNNLEAVIKTIKSLEESTEELAETIYNQHSCLASSGDAGYDKEIKNTVYQLMVDKFCCLAEENELMVELDGNNHIVSVRNKVNQDSCEVFEERKLIRLKDLLLLAPEGLSKVCIITIIGKEKYFDIGSKINEQYTMDFVRWFDVRSNYSSERCLFVKLEHN